MICDSCYKAKKKKIDKPQPIGVAPNLYMYNIGDKFVYGANKKSIRNPDKEQGVFAIYNEKNEYDAKDTQEHFNISKFYIPSQDFAKEPVATPNENKLWAKSGKLKDKYFNIDKNKPHLTAAFSVHGDKEFRTFCKEEEEPGPATGLIDDFFSLFKPGDIESKKSFYFKSAACYGAYHDGTKMIFDKIQEILEKCKGEPPKCFVKIGKKDFPLCISYGTTNGENIDKKVILPNEEEPEIETDEEYSARCNKDAAMHYACCTNPAGKDKCFDYYYVTKNAIYKVPHALVHNRVKLIDEGKFDKEFQKYQKLKNIDINEDPDDEKYKKKISEMSGLARKCTDEKDFNEWWKHMEFIKKHKKGEYEKWKKDKLITIPKPWHEYY